ncbi:flagellar hook-basal body complex protein FliE [Pseudooceanicola sp. C21-150M6]|uniref:flagellar hook-basal body complex protein FliE n=1 Tax=Pseudooceanicola sp. C21-150M6 TaxID=3434355 RepID=UPI003D7F1BC6
MDLNAQNVIRKYQSSRNATDPIPGSGAGGAAGQAISDFAETLRATEEQSKASMTGNVDPHALVLALSQTELAVETAVTIRNKVVEAYQEILRMPV